MSIRFEKGVDKRSMNDQWTRWKPKVQGKINMVFRKFFAPSKECNSEILLLSETDRCCCQRQGRFDIRGRKRYIIISLNLWKRKTNQWTREEENQWIRKKVNEQGLTLLVRGIEFWCLRYRSFGIHESDLSTDEYGSKRSFWPVGLVHSTDLIH